MMRRPWGVLLAIAAGCVLSLAFAPVAVGPLAVIGIGMLAAVQRRTPVWFGLLTGFLAGLAFFLLLLSWMRIIGVDAWIAASGYCAIWFALLGAGTSLVSRLPWWPVWTACLWVLTEALRGSAPTLAFTWGRLAFSQPEAPWGRLAALVGQPGVTFALALVGCALVAAIVDWRNGSRRPAVIWLGIAMVITLAAATIPLPWQAVPSARTLPVAIVQGGTPQTGMGAMDVRRAVLDNHVSQTLALAARVDAGTSPTPRLVLWPENSSDIDPLRDSKAARAISASADAIGAPILVGAVMVAEGSSEPGLWNVGLLWQPGSGPSEMYVKRHLVPFGEYVPFRSLIASHVQRLDRVASDFIPGDRPGLFVVDGVTFGDLICFEVAYDDVVHALLGSDAGFLTVQTNNATFAGTAQPEQQLAISRMRAIEGSRLILVAATTGVSAVIAPDGHVTQSLAQGSTGSLSVDVSPNPGRSPATALGDLPEIVLSIIGLVAVVLAGVRATRDRRRDSPSM